MNDEEEFEHVTMESVMDGHEAEMRRREVPEFVVTEGRAYHPGDIVFLRMPLHDSGDYARARDMANQVEAKSGLILVILDTRVEVVEPKPV